jgi:Leucine-rich repeat (LRR) protein
MKNLIVLISIFFLTGCRTQDIGMEYEKARVYKNLKIALRNKSEVVFLNLSEKNLSSLPENIGELKNLKVLNLDRNAIKNFPESFWELEQLEVLILSRNGLDYLPKEIGRLKNLKKLYISRNNLSSLPNSITELKGLKRIDASFNKLSDKDGEFIKKALPECIVIIDLVL